MNDQYHHLGLQANPFVAEPTAGVAAHLWVERGDVPPTVASCCLVQLLGEKGAGKTSLMLHWRTTLPGPYHYVPPAAGRWQPPPLGRIAYWDELDRLPLPLLLISLVRARMRGATIVAGSHRDLAWAARASGLAVRTIRFAPISAGMLGQWAAQRIADARLSAAAPLLALDAATAARIAGDAGTSWRTAANLLHIWAAEQAHSASVQQQV